MTENEYFKLVNPYEEAMNLVVKRLYALNYSLCSNDGSKPVHSIHYRIKAKNSLEEKLMRKQKEPTIANAQKYLQDIAGVRIICYFIKDIYNIVDKLKDLEDIEIIEEIDYIKVPKHNGYRSYHVIISIPLYNLDGFDYVTVELQLRTLSMDFWASMEHKILYKHDVANRDSLEQEMATYATQLVNMEMQIERLNSEVNDMMNFF